VAMFKALSEGHREFRRVVVVADTEAPTPPCGACRQILWEFGGDLEVILANLRRHIGPGIVDDLDFRPMGARRLFVRAQRAWTTRVRSPSSPLAARGHRRGHGRP